MIKHIVFDFGGVILDLDGVHTGYPHDLALIFNLPIEETQEIWNSHKTELMTGQENPKQFLVRMKNELGLGFNVEAGLAVWEQRNAISKERIDWKLIKMIDQLKANYQIHMLTDQIHLDNGASGWIQDINQHFHTIFRSYEEGFRKPFPEAYHNLLSKIRASRDPGSVAFIDDSSVNSEAANSAGIHGILYKYKDHDKLTKQFNELGITF